MTKPEMNPPDLGCKRPSRDWYCSRQPGHEGPCAARRVSCLNVNDGIERGAPWKIVTQAEGLADFLSSPPPSETKLKEALETLEHFAGRDLLQEARTEERNGKIWLLPRVELPELTAARSSLESLFKEMETEWAQWQAIAETNFKDFQSANDKLSALRSLQLTESEDWQLDQAIEDAEALPRPDVQIECLRGILEKLRRISSKATSEDL